MFTPTPAIPSVQCPPLLSCWRGMPLPYGVGGVMLLTPVSLGALSVIPRALSVILSAAKNLVFQTRVTSSRHRGVHPQPSHPPVRLTSSRVILRARHASPLRGRGIYVANPRHSEGPFCHSERLFCHSERSEESHLLNTKFNPLPLKTAIKQLSVQTCNINVILTLQTCGIL